MAEILLFPLSRSTAHVSRLANALDQMADETAMTNHWQQTSLDYCRQLFDRGVPDDDVNGELRALLDVAVHVIADRRFERSAREARRRERLEERSRLRLADPMQADLFAPPPAPLAPAVQRAQEEAS